MKEALPLSRNVPHGTPSGKRHRARFWNPWPDAQFHGVADFLKWALVERATTPRAPQPSPARFTRVTPHFPVPRAPTDTCVITWIGHTSFLLQLHGMNILLDPVWSDRASPVPFAGPKRWVAPGITFDTLPPIDLVVISHDHYDHLDRPTVRRIVHHHPTARWLAPLGVQRWLTRQGASVHAELDWWQHTTVGDITLTCVPAQHFSGRYPTNRNSTLWCGWTLRAPSHTIFFAGDTAYHPEFSTIAHALGPFDAAILPIGAYDPRWFMSAVHMDATQAVDAYMDLTRHTTHPCTFVASHWGTFKLTDEPMDEPPQLVRDTWQARNLPCDRLWIPKHGETLSLQSTSAQRDQEGRHGGKANQTVAEP